MNDPLKETGPLNATDRNTETARGFWNGHITLPSSFLTIMILLPNLAWLIVVRWCFNEVDSIRARLIEHEKVIYGFIEKHPAPLTPADP